jgi:beta-lactamase superfamily II metal-dependent hydrolase
MMKGTTIRFGLILLLLGITFSSFAQTQLNASGILSVFFFDAGGNSGYDAVLVQTPNGKNIIINSGADVRANEFSRFLLTNGVGRIHYLIASNASPAYVGQHEEFVWQFGEKVEQILDVGQASANSQYLDFIQAACVHEIEINTPRDGDLISIGSVDIRFFGPTTDQVPWRSTEEFCGEDYLDTNNDEHTYSLAFQISLGETSYFFAGDMGDEELEELLDRHAGELRSTVLKLPRHGGDVGFVRSALVDEVAPEFAVAMASPIDAFGRPCDTLLEELALIGIPTYITGIHGTVSMLTDGQVHVIDTDREVTTDATELQLRNSSARDC